MNASKKYFGTDGIRGPVSEKGISPEFALKLGIATGATLKSSWETVDVVIGRDTRSSGDMLASAFSSGLNQAGANVFNVGIMPSPAIAFLTKSIGANVGVVVSASHLSLIHISEPTRQEASRMPSSA